MPEPGTPNARRRSAGRWFKWTVVVIFVVTAGVLAYRNRPLTATERMLLGGWEQVRHFDQNLYDVGQDSVWFLANRRFEVTRPQMQRLPTGVMQTTQDVIQEGRWEASGLSLAKTIDVPGTSPWAIYRQKPILLFYRLIGRTRSRSPVRFEGPDRVWMNEVEFRRVEAAGHD